MATTAIDRRIRITDIRLFNAIESRLTRVDTHAWVGQEVTTAPLHIDTNGWGAFQHDGNHNQSVAAAVYKGNNAVGDEFYWLVSWDNRRLEPVKAYCELRKPGPIDWDPVLTNLEKSGSVYSQDNNFSVVSVFIGLAASDAALFVGILFPERAA